MKVRIPMFAEIYRHPFPGSPSPEIRKVISSLPSTRADHLEHIGAIDSHEPSHSSSHEGCLLCVSLSSEDWMAIAKLGGNPVWYLRLPNRDFSLIDFHAIKRPVRRALLRLAIAHGLTAPVIGYRVKCYDEEGEHSGNMEFTDKQEAEDNCQQEGDKPSRTTLYAATAKLEAYWNCRHKDAGKIETGSTFEAILAYFAEWVGTHDGIWWQDDYDPANYSCPHGGLFQSVLPKVKLSLEM